jgi:tetratricopeptide (TPR) repeat protein
VYPPTVSGIIHRTGDEATLEAAIDVRNRGRHQLESVSRPISALRFQQRIARDLALIVIRHQSPEMSIRNWQALDKFTEALTIWPPATTVTDATESRFRETEDALLAAQEYDPDSPLINFNLALLCYGKFDAEYNERALVMFDKATRTANLHLKGLAKIGLARCYCQEYHRFGQQTQVVLDKARATSAEAVELIKQAMREARKADAERLKYDYARALYCRAFAQHVTEKPEDIERGVRDYLEVIDITKPNVPDFVYNNLGYILMAKRGRFEPYGGPSDYDEAARYLNLALEQEPSQKMALANLGNVERLKGNYREAIGRYREALEIDPNYANGWNEFAWVYLEAAQPDKAEAAHKKALSLASSPDHQYDIKENYARILYHVGRRGEALALVRDVQKGNPDKITTNEWLAEIEGEMSVS